MNRSKEGFSALLDWGLRLSAALSLPAAAAMAIVGVPLISTLFLGGKFNAIDVEMTRQALVGYSVGLPALIFIKILAPAFYSRQDVKTPAFTAVVSLVLTQCLNIFFVWPAITTHLGLSIPASPPNWLASIWSLKHAGLALSISIGANLNAFLLYRALCKGNIFRPPKGLSWQLVRMALAAATMSAVLLWISGESSEWLLPNSPAHRLVRLVPLILAGAVVYFASLWLMGFRARNFSRSEHE